MITPIGYFAHTKVLKIFAAIKILLLACLFNISGKESRRTTPMVLKGFLMMLEGSTYVIPRVKIRSVVCKAITLTPVLPLYLCAWKPNCYLSQAYFSCSLLPFIVLLLQWPKTHHKKYLRGCAHWGLLPFSFDQTYLLWLGWKLIEVPGITDNTRIDHGECRHWGLNSWPYSYSEGSLSHWAINFTLQFNNGFMLTRLPSFLPPSLLFFLPSFFLGFQEILRSEFSQRKWPCYVK